MYVCMHACMYTHTCACNRIFMNGFIGGLWILVESPDRRLDVGMYSLRLSMETVWKLLLKKGKVKNIR